MRITSYVSGAHSGQCLTLVLCVPFPRTAAFCSGAVEIFPKKTAGSLSSVNNIGDYFLLENRE